MSIVERAIRKLQKSHQRQPQPAAAQPLPAPRSPQFSEAATAAASVVVIERPPVPVRRTIALDLARLRGRRLLPSLEQEREISAQYRQIKRPLIARGIGRGGERVRRGNALMLTSALPGEGKSFTSLNLALSMALERQLSVVLVDADVAQPRLSGEFDLNGDPGLLDLLEDDGVDPETLLVGTDLPTLKILPSGKPSSTATELLAGPRMEEVVRELCGRDAQRMVVFDSPPVLPTTEARALAHYMGQIVFVVRAGRTHQQAVLEALRLIGERDNVSFVLTHASNAGAGSYYYTSYGYGTYGDPAVAENQ
jgi:receptor protein-tyrosine kinase